MAIRLQQRDLNLLQDIGKSRFLTYNHISELWFNGSLHAARKRILKLKQASLLIIHQPAFRAVALVLLSRLGVATLGRNGFAAELHPSACDLPGIATLEHEIAVRDLKVAWTQASPWDGHQLEDFSLISQKLAFTTQFGTVRPDAYARTKHPTTNQSSHFFLEIDRGTEPLTVLEWKVVQYWNFYREGGFAERMGLPRQNFKLVPFRVVLIFQANARLRSVVKRLLAKGFHSFVCVGLYPAREHARRGAADAIRPIWAVEKSGPE